LHPYFGKESLLPFLEYADKGLIIMCKSSNLGSGELQDLETNGMKLYEYIAQQVVQEWNENDNCLLMVGATYPDELKRIREIAGDEVQILVPGVGAQEGNIEEMLKAGLNPKGNGLIVNSSRSVIYAKDPRVEAEKLKNLINLSRWS
jgi:orotidine-5'-phosphate decarboxylase